MVLLLAVSLMGSLTIAPVIAQGEVPAGEQAGAAETGAEVPAATDQLAAEPAQQAQQAPAPTGALEIRLTDANGGGLSGLFAVTDAGGAYHERWTEGGVAWFPELAAGTATVGQRDGTTDYGFDAFTPAYIDVPASGQAVLPIVNGFLDADGDGVGDSVDICGAGSDAVDTDVDGAPDACDATPNGDTDGDGIDELTDPTPNGDDDGDGVDNATDACPEGDDAVDTDADGTADACDETAGGDTPEEPATDEASTVVAEVAPEPVIVEGAAVTCDQLAGLTPTIASDLAEYAPGAVVVLTGAGWAPGQVVLIDVAAAEGGWSLAATMTAGHSGGFSYQLTLPEQAGAEYRVVATGQCAAPEETSEIVAAVAAEPEVVAEAPVTCTQADAVAPWIVTDLADYPPGARVTLTGGNWVAGQTIEILVEDDGIADAERGPWSHAATVTADEQGGFTYQFDLAPWYVADYSVVATGECREAKTTFTDTIQLGASISPNQVPETSTIAFSLTVTNTTTSPDNVVANNLGCIRVVIPGQGANGFNFVGSPTIVAPDGKTWNVEKQTPTGSTTLFIAWASTTTPTSELAQGESVTFQFSGTVPDNLGSNPIEVLGRTTNTPSVCASGPNSGSDIRFPLITVNISRLSAVYSAAATITPTSVPASNFGTFTVRVTNNGTGTAPLGSAKILIPTGFTDVSVVSFTSSAGGSWNPTYIEAERKIGVNSGGNTISPGGYIEVTFTVKAPPSGGPRSFDVEAWNTTGYTGTSFGFTAQPSVMVTLVCPPTVGISAVNFGTFTWGGAAYQPRTADLAIQILPTATGCTSLSANWSLQASTSAMNRTGGGGTIAATSISYRGDLSGTAPSGLQTSTATVPLGTTQTIATGTSSTATNTTWNAKLSLAPPAAAPAGSYTGTVTVTAATAAP